MYENAIFIQIETKTPAMVRGQSAQVYWQMLDMHYNSPSGKSSNIELAMFACSITAIECILYFAHTFTNEFHYGFVKFMHSRDFLD